MSQPYRVLFVCMGNICRSPSAHAVFRNLIQRAGLQAHVAVDSAGTHDYHAGNPPDPRSQEHALRRGIDMSDLRARLLTQADFETFDLLLAMDLENLATMEALSPPRHHGKLRRLSEFGLMHKTTTIADPYYGEARDFERVLDLVEDACNGLLIHLRRELKLPVSRG